MRRSGGAKCGGGLRAEPAAMDAMSDVREAADIGSEKVPSAKDVSTTAGGRRGGGGEGGGGREGAGGGGEGGGDSVPGGTGGLGIGGRGDGSGGGNGDGGDGLGGGLGLGGGRGLGLGGGLGGGGASELQILKLPDAPSRVHGAPTGALNARPSHIRDCAQHEAAEGELQRV